MFVVTTRRAAVKSTLGLFRCDQVLQKGRLLPIIADSGTLISDASGFYMWSDRKAIRLIVNFFC